MRQEECLLLARRVCSKANNNKKKARRPQNTQQQMGPKQRQHGDRGQLETAACDETNKAPRRVSTSKLARSVCRLRVSRKSVMFSSRNQRYKTVNLPTTTAFPIKNFQPMTTPIVGVRYQNAFHPHCTIAELAT